MTDPAVRAVAEAVVDVLLERGLLAAAAPRADGRVLTAAEVALLLGRRRQWVYAHADELGGFRYGPGPRARLGFDRVEIERWKQAQHIRAARGTAPVRRQAPTRRAPAKGAALIPFEPMGERRIVSPPPR